MPQRQTGGTSPGVLAWLNSSFGRRRVGGDALRVLHEPGLDDKRRISGGHYIRREIFHHAPPPPNDAIITHADAWSDKCLHPNPNAAADLDRRTLQRQIRKRVIVCP